MAPAINWLRDAFGHLKAIGYNEAAAPMFGKAAIEPDAGMGIVAVDGAKGFDAFVSAAKKHRIWDREKLVVPPR
jgi:catalase